MGIPPKNSLVQRGDYMGKAKDLTGERFGRLTVVGFAGRGKNGRALWFCRCDCGGGTIVFAENLRRGSTQSCGCIHKERTAAINKTHGMTKTRLFGIWAKMKQRCYNPNNPKFPIYGAEGKMICDEWQHFEPFYTWAMANGYQDNLTIDRIDNSKGYSPDNCRWTTVKEQANNRRTCRIVEYNGKSQTIKQWSEELGIGYHTLIYRFNKGWSADEAFTTPVGTHTRG